jgi:hypothetical protein
MTVVTDDIVATLAVSDDDAKCLIGSGGFRQVG